jgi:hypothetical protein
MMYNDTAFMPHKQTAIAEIVGDDRHCFIDVVDAGGEAPPVVAIGYGGALPPPRPPVFTPAAADFCPRCWDAGQNGGCPACGKTLPVFKLPPLTAHDLKRSGQTLKLAQIQNTVDVAIRVLEEQLGCLNAARAQLQLVRDSL